MKKILFGMMACAALCACTSDDLLSVANQQVNTADGSVSYLTVKLKDVNSGTRGTDGGFAYGTASEQEVANANFYFYDVNGNYMATGSVGAITGTATEESDPAGDIEWNSGTVVAVYGLEEDGLPTQMLTVLNQPSDLVLTNKTLSEATAALAGTPYADGSGRFVMSTSVYDGGTGTGVVNTTALTDDDFSTEPIDLENDYPDGGVTVYVERLAAKVTASVGLDSYTYSDGYIDITEYVASEFVNGAPEGGVYVKLLGFDVDGVARDAYVVKNISDDAQWSGLTFVWNGSSNYRTYWGESPNYGVSTEYPTSSNGNTATEEADASTMLNEYLRYVDLKEPVDFGGAAYCGENTNTAGESGVLQDNTSNGITNLLVKGQVYTKVGEEDYEPLDIVEFHGMYYTAEDFLNKTVEDVVNYDFTVLVAEVINSLKENPTLSLVSDYIDELNDAMIYDHVYVSEAVTNHKVSSNNQPSSVSVFDGSMLSLYNLSDGNVDIFFNGAEQYYGTAGDNTGDQVDPDLCGKYDAEDIVYGGTSMDDYEFYFHIDKTKLTAGDLMEFVSLIVEINGEYYLPLDNRFSFTSESIFDDTKYQGTHTYTLRNFFLRAITVEADDIDAEFGSHYPNLFADGMMYYHTPIEHLGTKSAETIAEGDYGIVRNHYYNITITSLENLGRGIADEDEVIVPQPEITYYYLGADIDILSWKMVEQTVGW